MAMLEVNHLSIQFGGLRAVDSFHVNIEKGVKNIKFAEQTLQIGVNTWVNWCKELKKH